MYPVILAPPAAITQAWTHTQSATHSNTLDWMEHCEKLAAPPGNLCESGCVSVCCGGSWNLTLMYYCNKVTVFGLNFIMSVTVSLAFSSAETKLCNVVCWQSKSIFPRALLVFSFVKLMGLSLKMEYRESYTEVLQYSWGIRNIIWLFCCCCLAFIAVR